MDTIYFYIKHEAYGEFSNFAPYGIEMNNLWWPTVEHYFQAQKFEDENYQEKIRTASKARDAANLGRSRKLPIRTDWEEVKEQIMYETVLKKFQTHKNLRKLLLDTENFKIVENSPIDYYWGCGQDGTGLNKLGEILMQVREELRND